MTKYPKVVYKITHNKTGRSYIGSTGDLISRLNVHFQQLRSGTHRVEDMISDLELYGEDFTVSVIDSISDITELDKEYEAMERYRTMMRGTGYNYRDQRDFVSCKKITRKKPIRYPNLSAEIARKGFTKVELAKCMNMSTSTLCGKLSGRITIYFKEAVRLKQILKTDLSLEVLFEEAD